MSRKRISQLFPFLWESLPELKAFQRGEYKDRLSPPAHQALEGFLAALAGKEDPAFQGTFLGQAVKKILAELETEGGKVFLDKLEELAGAKGYLEPSELLTLFFPEQTFGGANPADQEAHIRRQRLIKISSLAPDPITHPARQMVFTSNALLTLPPEDYKKNLSPEIRERVAQVETEKQRYWFDHPVLMGVDREANELIYGLKGLAEAFEYEKKAGHAGGEDKMTVILSLSVTHDGLKDVAKDYLAQELKAVKGLEDLRVYLFTENETRRISQILESLGEGDPGIEEVFGVDGRYGRHYSFLKAVVPLWQIVVDPQIKGTFKIDLDQVFPQNELVEEGGKTAFQHFQSELWGARGVDSQGREVELGMIAGALVNEKDIHKSIFTPDVPLPGEGPLRGEAQVFNKQLPMAVSTLGELMTRYGREGMPDGRSSCLSRVHVTGGTNGILLSALRKKRPFTPSFIGRAEDQSYLMSLFADPHSPFLRYVHAPGLIMRHDKEAFAGDAIAAAKLGTWIADLLRVLYFSYYAAFLPGGVKGTKEELDPFTGCFISDLPFIKIFTRFLLKVLESPSDGDRLLEQGALQLGPFLTGEEDSQWVEETWRRERRAWNHYYDALDLLEAGIARGEKTPAEELKALLLGCRIG